MKFLFTILSLILFIALKTNAQTGRLVKGVVKDSTGYLLAGTNVKMLTGTDSTTVITNADGSFAFNNVKVNQFSLVFTSIGYQALKRRFILQVDNKPAILPAVIMKTETRMLNTVVIADVNPVKMKEDTVEFNADAYKVRDGAPVEDVIRKLPGMDVDKDGNITAQGKSVTKVRVNGKDFFGGDVKTATKNLPAEIIQSIQVIDDYGDQANITGIKTGEPEKVLNINIKQSKNYGYFGQASLGGGRDAIPGISNDKESDRYVASASVFSFNGNRQLAFLGNLNNTNTNLFSFGGGGPRGGGPGGPPGGNNNSSNGITTARSFGFNYRDSWGKKVTAYGSYSYANNSVNTISSTIQNNLSNTNPSTNTQSNNQQDDKLNHRVNFNIEYKPDTVNYVKITPTFAYASTNTNADGSSLLIRNAQTVSNYTFSTLSKSTEPNYGANVLFNHKFNTHGRNFSVSAGAGSYSINKYQNPVYTYIDGARNAPLNQFINTDSRTDSVGTTISYMEPVSKKGYLEASYAYHYAYTTADKVTDTLAGDGTRNNYDLLSNNYNSTFITHRFGLNYRFIDKKYNYVLGLVAQPTILNGASVMAGQPFKTNNNTFNWAPTARFIYNFSRNQSLSVNYNGSSMQPTYTELQPVTDFSNASYPVQGNPDLKPEFNNTLAIRYNKFNFESGNVFFSNLSFTKTDNRIVANTITYPRNYAPNTKLAGSILTQYLNADGYYSAQGFYVFAKPWEKRKYNLFMIGNILYNNNVSYISNVDSVTYNMTTEKNIAKNLVLSQGARFRVSITDVIDAEASTTYSVNTSRNSIKQANVNNNFRSLNLGINGKSYFFKDWTLSYDYSKMIYYGYTGATNPNILNTYIERRFLKGNAGTLRFSVMDVFNENTGYTTIQNGSYVTQTNSNRLGRYFLLSFTLKLQKFAGKRPAMGPGGMGGPPPGGGPGGPPPGGGF
ncbi:outer membrane beta-barrel protein [Mucilaginibacter celer]|uniref:TonB-dependent receptor n=1 Tax=Mucilaginibacter celer TaxID=2305508 RepID=A0A494VT68_9SPHI|nr:outer membrane beta-barrel protein [Mucilaginibacter celer]AYL94142.1 TonB-dependent receptor [Mucilaginibacter celer]